MEIGSEFWSVPTCESRSLPVRGNVRHAMSGRTALELIAADLKAERGAKSVYMPAYCCESMEQPFIRQGYTIKHYAVEPFNGGVHRQVFTDHGCDAIVLLDYFGFASEETAVFAMAEKQRDTAVIIDCVQSAFSQTKALEYADYSLISWRKWFFSCAATAQKHCGQWLVPSPEKADGGYIALRRKAARLKESYIVSKVGSKDAFLSLFADAEKLLDEDYSDYAAEQRSLDELNFLDTGFIREQRRKNAAFIMQELEKLPHEIIKPLFCRMSDTDVPLFVPVLVHRDVRDELRCYLIANKVYCPVHWRSELGGADKLYDCELSLICDQRYGMDDMARQMTLISEFINGHLF